MACLYYRALVAVVVAAVVNGLAGQHWTGVGERVVSWSERFPADRVRLGVRDEGVYRVTVAEIAKASGEREPTVRSALASGGLAMHCRQRPVAWMTDGEALYFYGVPTEELFAPENVYWLAFGQGELMKTAAAVPVSRSATNGWFMFPQSYRSSFLAPYDPRDRRSSAGTLTNVLNFGEWVPASTTESIRTQSRTLLMPGYCVAAATGLNVRVSLASYREFTTPDSHVCEILINGVSCGTRSWSGEQAVTFDYAVPEGAAKGESVVLSVRNAWGTAAVSDFMLVDVVVTYPRVYVAESKALICSGGTEPTVAVGGLLTESPCVWNITEPETPTLLSETSVRLDTNGMWRAAFACGDATVRYAVFDAAAGRCFEPAVSGVRDTDWFAPGAMPELAIVVPPQRWVAGFAAAVNPLKDFRNSQGLKTCVIDAEALYNAFTDGLVHPEAFRRFCEVGVRSGAERPLRYLLFAGHGGSDYKLEVFRLNESPLYPALFPLYLVSQAESSASAALMLPNDQGLGDATGGAVPEVAVGRFIARTASELTAMVNKTIRYELTAAWKVKAVVAADWQNTGEMYANFVGIAGGAAAQISQAEWTPETFFPTPDQSYLGSLWKNTYYETGVHYELQEGAGFFYFTGHSSDTIAGNSGQNKLFNATMLQQGTWPFAPVALLLGCRMGRWTLLDLKTQLQSIAEAGVRNPSSGFAAAVSATGYMTTPEAVAFSDAFCFQIAKGALRLGDAWQGAFTALGDGASAKLRHMTLLGDPSLFLRAGRTARGTPTAWLLEQGLSNDAYSDLKDPDNDGFPTWQEFLAGTSHMSRGLRIRSLSLAKLSGGVSETPVFGLSFEPIAGLTYRVMTSPDLTEGTWVQAPWRADGGGIWSLSAIAGDWPVKTVEVPFVPNEGQRFYRIELYRAP